jgi:cyanophycinase
VKLDRLGDITSELSTNLVKSIVLPGGLLEWLSRPLPERLRDKWRSSLSKPGEMDGQRTPVAAGPLVLMGGTPVPDESIVAMIHLSGGRTARLAVIPAAAADPGAAAEQGVRFFTRFGMRRVEVVEITTRERADSPEWAQQLAAYDAVFLCGEDRALGLTVLYGTAVARTLAEMMAAGKPVAALGGSAAILGEWVLVPQDGQERLVEGLGLAPGLLVDVQFTQESRFNQVAKALNAGACAHCMGAGLDAGAAMVVRDGEAKVLGDSSVTFMDPRESKATGDAGQGANGAMCGLKVHVLMDGFLMNLRSRKPMAPPKESFPAVGER